MEAEPMYERERALFAFQYGYARLLAADIPDERLAEQPAGIVNHPAWQLGHLVAAADRVQALLGGPPAFSDEWNALFGRGSVPTADRGAYPSKPALMAALETAHARLAAAAENADPAVLARPNPLARLRPALPTVGDLVAYILTTHEGLHLGQLSAWRRAAGFPSVQ